GPLGLLASLVPEVVTDPADGSVLIPRSHRHQVAIGEHGGITLVPSVYAWPHVRVTCDHPPWPLTLTYPIDPLIRPLAPPLAPAHAPDQPRPPAPRDCRRAPPGTPAPDQHPAAQHPRTRPAHAVVRGRSLQAPANPSRRGTAHPPPGGLLRPLHSQPAGP